MVVQIGAHVCPFSKAFHVVSSLCCSLCLYRISLPAQVSFGARKVQYRTTAKLGAIIWAGKYPGKNLAVALCLQGCNVLHVCWYILLICTCSVCTWNCAICLQVACIAGSCYACKLLPTKMLDVVYVVLWTGCGRDLIASTRLHPIARRAAAQ